MYSSLSTSFLQDFFGKLIKLLCFFGVNHAETPSHDELQKGEYPGPGDASDKWLMQDFCVGSHDGQCEIETEEKERDEKSINFIQTSTYQNKQK